MDGLPPSLETIIQELAKFPGIGKKTAQRLGFHLLDSPEGTVDDLARALKSFKERIHECPRCHFIAERELCEIDLDTRRDQTTLCVVERVMDVLVFERMGEYRGLYHVLGGVIAPLDGVAPEDLHIDDLLTRLGGDVREVILATHPSMEGDTTALYIDQQLAGSDLKVTKLARGVPMGSQLEFTDEATLASAYTARVDL